MSKRNIHKLSNATISSICGRWSHLTVKLQAVPTKAKIDAFCTAICERGGPMPLPWGFIDGTTRPVASPVADSVLYSVDTRACILSSASQPLLRTQYRHPSLALPRPPYPSHPPLCPSILLCHFFIPLTPPPPLASPFSFAHPLRYLPVLPFPSFLYPLPPIPSLLLHLPPLSSQSTSTCTDPVYSITASYPTGRTPSQLWQTRWQSPPWFVYGSS